MEPQLDIFDLKAVQITKSKHELIQLGQHRQAILASTKLGEYVPVHRDPIKAIQKTEDNMIPELLPLRHKRMIASPFAFFRGTAELMERDLKHQHQSKLPIIICGDAHIQNFGFYASPERQLLFGLNDFDEARIGNWESDLKRLLVSAQLAGEENGFDQEDLHRLLKRLTKTYRHAVKRANQDALFQRYYFSFKYSDMIKTIQLLDHHKQPQTIQAVMKRILKKSHHSNSAQAVKKLASIGPDGEYHFMENVPRARHVSEQRYQQLLAGFRKYRQHVRPDIQVFLANFHISDLIRYSVGVGSFGTRCYLFLLTGNDGTPLVLQMKEALPLRYNIQQLVKNQVIANGQRAGRRIVTAQRTLQSSSDPFLGATSFAGRSYYVRQFRDMKESINVAKLDLPSFQLYCETCVLLLAMAHYQSPTAPMIRGYLKHQKELDGDLADWAVQYANQVHQDYTQFVKYIEK
ncbi:DUF2252 domain-containing protein [uncultured Limosilactobacillus sp.]|uniref:DUF2252 domain-containing protein n=1 Tax=uncultured Limosilactobacillus sp. TaxID=2837629 RepID=UPI0025EC51D3|nr:DUF2252 domain-containing protein [uncultured Limosilactobacillus sp.]